MADTTIIRFLRCKIVQENRDLAMVHLINDVNHIIGQPVLVSYYTDATKKKIDTILVMGIKNGYGKDCFSVISTGQFVIVWDVVNTVPDISQLVHSEAYLYHDLEENIWYEVYSNDGIYRTLNPITEDHKLYINLKDNMIWVSGSDLQVRPLSGMYTREEIDAIIEQIKIETDWEHIEEELRIVMAESRYAVEKVDELEQRIIDIEEGETSLKAIASLHNYVKEPVRLVAIDGVSTDKVWYYTRDNEVRFMSGTMEFELVYHNYDGDMTTGFDKVEIRVGEDIYVVSEPNDRGYYTNPIPVVLRQKKDSCVPIEFRVTYKELVKSGFAYIYGISAPRYYGRIEDPENININDLTEDSTYTWNTEANVVSIEKGLDITAVDNDGAGYFAFVYPKAWGDLTKISATPLIYYTKDRDNNNVSTFTKKTLVDDDIEYNVYVYRNPNREEADNLKFI